MNCPHNIGGWCSRPDCGYFFNEGCSWMAERTVVHYDNNTGTYPEDCCGGKCLMRCHPSPSAALRTSKEKP